jgi:hypothetical protein
VGFGDHHNGFKLMETAHEKRELQLAFLKVEPVFDHLRIDPRFTTLIKQIGLD